MKKLIGLLAISFALINISGVLIYFAFNTDFYFKNIDQTQSIINTRNINNLYDFLQNKSDLNNNFTHLEASHMEDVQHIFIITDHILQAALTLFVIIALFLIYYKKTNQILKGLFIGSIISLSFVLILLLCTLLDFTYTFHVFHRLFFPQGNWEFVENSSLITLFPESFFIAISKTIFITISIISIFVISIYLITKKIPHRLGIKN